MRVFFDKVDCLIQDTGILAEAGTINSRNSVQPVFSIGKIGSHGQTPYGPVGSTIQFNYFPELDNEPNKFIIDTIKNITNDQTYTGVMVIVGGMTGFNCYLTRYSLEADINDPVRAQVNFVTFKPVLGQPASKARSPSYNTTNSIAHGWSTYLTDTGNYLNNPTYNLSYEARVEWDPNYVMGNPEPSGVSLMSVNETVAFTRDVSRTILHSGESGSVFLGTTGDMRFLNISFAYSSNPDTSLASLRIPLSGFIIQGSDTQAQLNDFMRTRTVMTRGY